MNLRKKGRGVTSQNVCGIYSAGKYPDFAVCVRTQIDFYLKGGITAHPNNKTRLKRFICVYNGHHARKRNMNTAKTVYLCNIVTTNLHIYTLKSANSATFPLTPHSNTLSLTSLRFA